MGESACKALETASEDSKTVTSKDSKADTCKALETASDDSKTVTSEDSKADTCKALETASDDSKTVIADVSKDSKTVTVGFSLSSASSGSHLQFIEIIPTDNYSEECQNLHKDNTIQYNSQYVNRLVSEVAVEQDEHCLSDHGSRHVKDVACDAYLCCPHVDIRFSSVQGHVILSGVQVMHSCAPVPAHTIPHQLKCGSELERESLKVMLVLLSNHSHLFVLKTTSSLQRSNITIRIKLKKIRSVMFYFKGPSLLT